EKDIKVINNNNYSIYKNKKDTLLLTSKQKKYKLQFSIGFFPSQYINKLKNNDRSYVKILSDTLYDSTDKYLFTQQKYAFLDPKEMKMNHINVVRARKLEDFNKYKADLCYILEIQSEILDDEYFSLRRGNPIEYSGEIMNIVNALSETFLLELVEKVENDKYESSKEIKDSYIGLKSDIK
ncbi:MAG: hypothetical protein ACRCZO_17430, partial [Cetobacterium sp.]